MLLSSSDLTGESASTTVCASTSLSRITFDDQMKQHLLLAGRKYRKNWCKPACLAMEEYSGLDKKN